MREEEDPAAFTHLQPRPLLPDARASLLLLSPAHKRHFRPGPGPKRAGAAPPGGGPRLLSKRIVAPPSVGLALGPRVQVPLTGLADSSPCLAAGPVAGRAWSGPARGSPATREGVVALVSPRALKQHLLVS